MKRWLFFLFVLPIFTNAQTVITIAGKGTAGYSGDGNMAAFAELNNPYFVKFDNFGNLYIADNLNNAIRRIDNSGIISTVVGNGFGAGTTSGGYSGDGGPATNAKLNGPADMVFDTAGNLIFSDNRNNAIRKVDKTGIITTIAGTGLLGYYGDGGPATAAKLWDPFGLAIDDAGNIFFTDNGNHRVRKVSITGIITTFAGSGISGYNGDGIPATAANITYPGFIAFSPAKELYIADYMNSRIRKVDASGIITTIAGNGIMAANGDGSPALSASLYRPWAITFDNSGNYYISDWQDGHSIRKVDNSTNIISTIAGNGTIGYGGDGGLAINAQFKWPLCSAVDASGNLYIADIKNNRIRKIIYNTDVTQLNQTLQHISLSPNPVKDKITINTDGKVNHLVIVNAVGQVVSETQPVPSTREITLDIQNLPPSIYLVKVNGIYTGKFVKE